MRGEREGNRSRNDRGGIVVRRRKQRGMRKRRNQQKT